MSKKQNRKMQITQEIKKSLKNINWKIVVASAVMLILFVLEFSTTGKTSLLSMILNRIWITIFFGVMAYSNYEKYKAENDYRNGISALACTIIVLGAVQSLLSLNLN